MRNLGVNRKSTCPMNVDFDPSVEGHTHLASSTAVTIYYSSLPMTAIHMLLVLVTVTCGLYAGHISSRYSR